MLWAVILLIAASLIELLTWTGLGWRCRKYLSSSVILLQSIAVGVVFGFHPNTFASLILLASGYRVVNLLRLVEGRMEPDYLFVVSRKTSLRLMLGQAALGLLWLISWHFRITLNVYLSILGTLELLITFMLAYSTRRSIQTTRPFKLKEYYAERDLPSISVLIPARNETVDLEQCLSTLVASTYPKLEILVLDDCSQNKRTPEIIKGFAQAGVRFIAGELPPEHWLAKNYAYSRLVHEASGDILVFAGVDTRFSPDTLTVMIETLLERKKTLISVMPVNKLPGRFSLVSCLIQPTRYAWELALPRRVLNRPPVLSTCWAIYATKLADWGGLKAVSRSIRPERYFAKKAIHGSDGYSFIRSTKSIGLSSEKTLIEQRETAIRTRYPQLHRRVELVGLQSLLEVLAFIMPIFSVVWGLISLNWLVFSLGVTSLVWLSIIYAIICKLTFTRFMLKGLLAWPLAAVYDISLLNYSMWQYEFKEVIWKGRNICLPVMRAQPSDLARSN